MHFKELHFPCVIASALLTFALPLVQAAVVPGQGTWESSLQPRDLDGNISNGPEAFYDTAQGITWLADAFQAQTSAYQAQPFYAPGDFLLWSDAVIWATNLSLYGIDDWRLPKSFGTGAAGCAINAIVGGECGYNVNPASSELAHMFHVTLGNMSYIAPTGGQAPNGGLTNTGPFSNLRSAYSWSETSFDATHAWNFNFNFGYQGPTVKQSQGSTAWAVLDGDRGLPLAPVPEPGTMALWALGLLGVIGASRRSRESHKSPGTGNTRP